LLLITPSRNPNKTQQTCCNAFCFFSLLLQLQNWFNATTDKHLMYTHKPDTPSQCKPYSPAELPSQSPTKACITHVADCHDFALLHHIPLSSLSSPYRAQTSKHSQHAFITSHQAHSPPNCFQPSLPQTAFNPCYPQWKLQRCSPPRTRSTAS